MARGRCPAYQGGVVSSIVGPTDLRYISFLDPVTAPGGAIAFVATMEVPGSPQIPSHFHGPVFHAGNATASGGAHIGVVSRGAAER